MPLQPQPSVTVAEHYDHKILDQLTLTNKLPDDLAKKIIASPYHYKLLYHGIMKYINPTTNAEYAESYLLKEGDLVHWHQPELEGKDKNIARVEEVVLAGEHQSITFVSVQSTPRSAFSSTKLTYTYDYSDPQKPTFSVQLLANGNNVTAINLAKITYKQYLHRIEKLAANPSLVLDELQLISQISHRLSEKTNFHGLPYGMIVQFTVPGGSQQLINSLQQKTFLENALPRVDKVDCADTGGKLQIKDKLHLSLNNIKVEGLNLVPFEQPTVLSIVHNGDKDNRGYALELLSGNNIQNFDQLGYGVLISELGDQTSVTLGVYYNNSNLIAIADFFKRASSLLTDAVPDTKLFLHLSARGLLETFFKRFCEHLSSNLQIEPAKVQIIDLSSLSAPTSSTEDNNSSLKALRSYLGFLSGSNSRVSSRRSSIVEGSEQAPKTRSRSNSSVQGEAPNLKP